jgi:hypothetical protein
MAFWREFSKFFEKSNRSGFLIHDSLLDEGTGVIFS